MAYARAQGKLVTFDPNYRPPLWRSEAQARAETLWGLEQADVVKLSDEELSFLWGCTPEEGARRLREECGVALAMITLGPQGCYLENARGACRVPAPAVRPVDTTGAGDAFNGGFVAALAEGKDLFEACAFGNAVSNLAVTKMGTSVAMPHRAEVDAFIAANGLMG